MEHEADPGSRQEWATRYAQMRRRSNPLMRRAARSLVRTAFLSLAGTFKPPPREGLRFFYLHAVYDDQRDEFRRLLRRLARFGTFVTMEHGLEILSGKRMADGPAFNISFDDGFDNNHRNAFPVLRELGIPATFFVPSAYIGASDATLLDGWWDKNSNLPTRTMGWDAARELSDAGYEVGSHTRHHARLSVVSSDSERLRDEVAGSKHEIEEKLGKPCRYISWPFGTYRDFDDRARDAVVKAGYDACFSAVRGLAEPGRVSPFSIPRHHFEVHWPWPHVRYFAAGGGE